MPLCGTILEGTATETGERFFLALVENLVKATWNTRRNGDAVCCR